MTHRCLRRILGYSLAGIFALASAVAAAPLTGDDVIRLMDEALVRGKDHFLRCDLIVPQKGIQPVKMRFNLFLKGKKWRRLDFQSPGNVKGMRFLVRDVGLMYAYLPSQKKVRRVGSHVVAHGFMGSAYSHSDLTIITYGDMYTGKIVGKDERTWSILATRRPGKDFPYFRIQFKISKKHHLPLELVYFNQSGVKVKTETRGGIKCHDDICYTLEMEMTDHVFGNRTSKVVAQEWKPNVGLEDSLFSVRSLGLRLAVNPAASKD